MARTVVSPDGVEHANAKVAAAAMGIKHDTTVHRYCRSGRHGWRWGSNTSPGDERWDQVVAELAKIPTTTPEVAYLGFPGYD